MFKHNNFDRKNISKEINKIQRKYSITQAESRGVSGNQN